MEFPSAISLPRAKARAGISTFMRVAGTQNLSSHCCVLGSVLAGSWSQEPEPAVCHLLG